MTDMSTPIYVVCPVCASPDVAADASARWDYETQDWEISGIYDDKTCQTCGYEGYSFDEVAEPDLTPVQRTHIFDGADYPAPSTIRVCGSGASNPASADPLFEDPKPMADRGSSLLKSDRGEGYNFVD